jgi:uncharacterized protein (DUF1786 family)
MPDVTQLDPELVKRLRTALKSARDRRFIAVPIDTPDLEAILAHIDPEEKP